VAVSRAQRKKKVLRRHQEEKGWRGRKYEKAL
jgi:hypothetical protein